MPTSAAGPSGRCRRDRRRADRLPRGGGRADLSQSPKADLRERGHPPAGWPRLVTLATAAGVRRGRDLRAVRARGSARRRRPSTITSAARGRVVVVARHAHAVGAGGQHGQRSRPAATASARSRPSQSPDSQTGPTTSQVSGGASRSVHGTMPIQASYSAGRIRSFIAASTMQKFFAARRLQVQHLASAARRRCRRSSGRARTACAGGRGRAASMRASRARTSASAEGGVRRCR